MSASALSLPEPRPSRQPPGRRPPLSPKARSANRNLIDIARVIEVQGRICCQSAYIGETLYTDSSHYSLGLPMQNNSIHNPDRYMADLRQILSQGRKRIGLLVGAGAPTAIRVDESGSVVENGGNPLVPDVAGLTDAVISALSEDDKATIEVLKRDIDGVINIETILTRVRKLAQAIGSACVHGLDATGYHAMAQNICEKIGTCVSASLPQAITPYSEVASWIDGYQAAALN